MSDEEKEKMRQFLLANLKSMCFYAMALEKNDAMFAGLNIYCYLDNKEIFNTYFNKSGKKYVKNISDYYNDWLKNKIFCKEIAFMELLQATLKLLRGSENLSKQGLKDIITNVMLIVIHTYKMLDEKFEKYVGRLEYGGQESVSCWDVKKSKKGKRSWACGNDISSNCWKY